VTAAHNADYCHKASEMLIRPNTKQC